MKIGNRVLSFFLACVLFFLNLGTDIYGMESVSMNCKDVKEISYYDEELVEETATLSANEILNSELLDTKLKVPDIAKDAKAAGYGINMWTINDEEDMVELIRLGCDCIMTDNPELLNQVLENYSNGVYNKN